MVDGGFDQRIKDETNLSQSQRPYSGIVVAVAAAAADIENGLLVLPCQADRRDPVRNSLGRKDTAPEIDLKVSEDGDGDEMRA